MDTELLEWCIDISKHKNFTKVAEMHYISQQALSRQIIKLEDSLGVTLFERSTRSVSVTPAGEAFVAEAEKALGHINAACAKAKLFAQGYRDQLSIGCNGPSSRVNLTKMIKQFSAAYPQVDIQVKNATYPEIVDSFLLDRKFDLIVVGDFGYFDPVAYNKRQCKAGVIHAVFSRDHPLAKKPEVTRQELLEEQLIVLTLKNDATTQFRRAERYKNILGQVPRKIKLVEDTDTINMLVSSGLGYTFLNSDLMDSYNTDIFTYVPIQGVSAFHPTWIVWRKEDNNPTLLNFLKMTDEITI